MEKYSDLRNELLQNAEVLESYNSFEPEYKLIRQLIQLRLQQNLTQAELAERIGTKQSHISRLESGNSNPSLKFLKKVADGLGKELSISFV